MSVRAFTDDPATLLTTIKEMIDEGHITTWSYDQDGDFTHTPAQWKNKAWFKPEAQSDKLRLRIIGTTVGITREIFGVYHGRFIEMLIVHVSDLFTVASATPNPAKDEPTLNE